MKKEVEKIERIIKICYQVAKKNPRYNPEKPIISSSYFHLLAQAIASQITIDEGEVEKVIERQELDWGMMPTRCLGKTDSRKIAQALKKANIIKIEEGK